MFNLWGLILKQKEDKLKFAYIIFTIIVVCYAVFLVIFDILTMTAVSQNGAVTTSNFILFNVLGILLGVINLVFLIYVLTKNKRNLRSK